VTIYLSVVWSYAGGGDYHVFTHAWQSRDAAEQYLASEWHFKRHEVRELQVSDCTQWPSQEVAEAK
jgi:hypothetical protein